MAKNPPKKAGLRIPTAARAEEGQPRVCEACNESKEISHRTFAPSRSGLRGWKTICRACEGRAAQQYAKEEGTSGRPKLGTHHEPPSRITGFKSDPLKRFEDFEKEIDAKVERLQELTGKPRPPRAEIDQLIRELKAATRLWNDPAGFGDMTDEELAFRAFMRVLKPTLAGWSALGAIHNDIIAALLSKESNVVLLASRGSAKSTLTAMYVLWLLWRDPEQETVLIVSRSETHAKRALRAIKGFLSGSPLLAELCPDDDQLDSAFQIEVLPAKGKLGMSASVTCAGIFGQITGLRARTIVGDDVEGPQHDRADAVDRLEEQISEFQHVVVPGGRVVLLGTPQSEFSLYGRLARSGAWTMHRALLFESDVLDGKEEFESRWPERFTRADIDKKRKAVSKRQFNLHYRLDLSETALREQPWRLADLPVIDWPSTAAKVPVVINGGGAAINDADLPRGGAEETDNWRAVREVSQDAAPYTSIVAAVDPASGLAGRDAIGLAIVGVTMGGRVVIRVARGVRGETTQLAIQRVAAVIAEYRANRLIIEEGVSSLFGQTLSAALYSRGHPLSFERVKTGGFAKGKRIVQSISPALASGRVFICKDVLTNGDESTEFVIQFTSIQEDARKLRHDDVIDALSYALSDVGDVLAADEAEFVASARVNYEALKRMPLRRCPLNEDELEKWAEADENEIVLQQKLEALLETQRREMAEGVNDLNLQKRIDSITADLQKFRGGGVRRIGNLGKWKFETEDNDNAT